MNKLEMAQRFAEILLSSGLKGEWDLPKDGEMYIGIASDAWKLADAMQAELDNREDKSIPDVFKKDKDGNCLHTHTTFGGGECFDCGVNLKEEWKPDWSQAPERAVAYTVDNDGFCAWHFKYPVILGYGWTNTLGLLKAPSFEYKGSWQDSLRKRPK